MEKNIKDFPELVKDTKSGAILLKRPKLTNDQIRIKHLKKQVSDIMQIIKEMHIKLNLTSPFRNDN